MRSITISLLIVLSVCSAAFADTSPGPTSHLDSPAITVAGEDLAVLDAGNLFIQKQMRVGKEDPIFPQTYIQGDHYLAWKIDTATGEISSAGASLKPGLSQQAQSAIMKAPPWLRTALVDRFLDLSEDDAATFAELILNPEDERYVDELAFLIAMTGNRDITYDRSADLMAQNVRLIYEYDQYLDYVTVVDHGTPEDEDYWTTVEYIALVDDEPTTFEVPKEIYYWYIVHPKLDMERVEYVDPATGATRDPEDGGRFWRDYLFTSGDRQADYTRPYFLLNPNEITEAELQDWGSTATSYFAERNIYNIDAILHENGEPVFVEFSYGKGTVIATTMTVEVASPAAQRPLMDNMLAYGCGDMTLPTNKNVVILDDSPLDNDLASTLQTAMTSMSYENVYVVQRAAFPGTLPGDLTLDDIDKVIIPSGATHETYEIFADGAPQDVPVLAWLQGGYRVLEMHLAGAIDLSDITFVGGYKIAAPGPGSETDTVAIAGRPLLSDVMALADHVWDGVVYNSLSGDRPFSDDGSTALKILGNWIGKNMMDNISEWIEKNNASSVERAIQPTRIIRNHFGNCGEDQDVWTAVARTCLIPAMNVSDTNEDHVWNEFYHDGQWHYLQNDWSNGPTRIATPGGNQDTDYCGEGCGKTTSFIFRWDGNGEIVSVIERYSQFITVEFEITDAAGQPVPGAKISLASEGYYAPHFNTLGFFVFTDADGRATVTLGDLRNYYARVDSGAGVFPDDNENHYSTIVSEENAIGGSTLTWSKEMPDVMQGEITVLDDAKSEAKSKGEGLYGLNLSFGLHQRFQHLMHEFNATEFTRYSENKGLSVYLVDEENFADCRGSGLHYTAQKAWEGVMNFDQEIYPPGDGNPWYVLISNRTNPESVMTMDLLSAEASENPNPTDDDDDDDDDDADDDSNNADDDLSSEASAKEDDDDVNDESACGC
jgi:Transglutaminase-like superfamily